MLLPVLASLGMASMNVARDESAMAAKAAKAAEAINLIQAAAADPATECCNTTPCFIGCPVGGVFRVRFPSLEYIGLMLMADGFSCAVRSLSC